MATITRSLYASVTGTANDVAHLDVPFAGRIIGVDLSIVPTTATTGDSVIAEVSSSSTAQTTTNDPNGIICRAAAGSYILTTSGSTNLGSNKFCGPMAIDIPAGTRIYLHATQVGTSSTKILATLHIQR